MARNLFEYHPVIGYRFIPGLRARVRHEGGGYLVQCNQAGFRCRHEFTAAKPAGTMRVIVVGDSYTAGDGVSNAFRWSDRLEQRLLDTGANVQILNFGLPGSGTDQQLLAFRELGRGIEYDVLVLAPMVENILRNLDAYRLATSAFSGGLVERPKPYFTVDDAGLQLHHVPVPKNTRESEANGEPSPVRPNGSTRDLVHTLLRGMTKQVDRRVPGFRAFTQRVRGLTHPPQYDDPQDPAWRLMRAILTGFIDDAQRVRQRGVILAPWPTFGHIEGGLDPKPYVTRFRELAVAKGVAFVNVLPRFIDEPRAVRTRCRFAIDEHPTRLGHLFFADALYPHIREHIKVIAP